MPNVPEKEEQTVYSEPFSCAGDSVPIRLLCDVMSLPTSVPLSAAFTADSLAA